MPPITLKELSKILGFSTTTISLVMNGKAERYNISNYTIQKIMKKARELNYHPSGYGLAVSGKATKTLGLIHPYVRANDEFFTRCLMSLVPRIQTTHHCLINLKGYAEETHEPIRGYIENMIGKMVDGLFISVDVYDIPFDMMNELHEQGFPLVLVFFRRELWDILKNRFHCYAVDRKPGMVEAARYVISTGCPKATFFSDIHGGNSEKAEVLADVFSRANVPFVPYDVKGYLSSTPESKAILSGWLRSAEKGEVIFLGSDYEARAALNMALDMGKRVPDDVQIIGFNNDPISYQMAPRIATIEQPLDEVAERAVKRMLELLETAGNKTESVMIPTRFIAGETIRRA